MKIGGFVKQSLIDWEGKVAAVIFTKGCNFRCGFCHNPSLVLPKLMADTDDIPENEIFDYLKSRKNWLDGVVVTGGEPTIQHDLTSFLQRIKEHGFPIKLDTNGSNPETLKILIETKLIDFVAMDIKTVLDLDDYQRIAEIKIPDLIEKIKSSIKILKDSTIDYQLRTTILPKLHSEDIIRKLQKEYSYCNYQLQEYREGNTIDAVNAQQITRG